MEPNEEGDLLETLISSLSNEQAFMMGKVMGIMRKGDQHYIDRLKDEIRELQECVFAEEEPGGDGKG